ncbi:hypothetical protein DFH08DRAFT_713618 [Mycena albidolilacea]|uniref:DUF6593 domain-containing protein n=1 Tax=Mycena albidolilacea TaxID=1033008 RepID=A0AAD6ZFQ4_9AGAR|nr:hypothetical protein DFH08DRAFT_713618 [Mycena albidolilacea]
MKMEFATNSVRNTTLATADDDPYYEIVTRFWHPHITKINKLDPSSRKLTTVCEIDNKKGREAKIRFMSGDRKDETTEKKAEDSTLGEWVSSEAILKLAPEKPGGIFVDSNGVEYRWKTHNRNFLLVRCDDVGKLPVVTYHPYKRHLGFWRMSKHAMLEIKPQLFDDLERLIASYLLVERQRRHRTF